MAKKKKGKVVQMLSPENYIRKRALALPIFECKVNQDWHDTQLAQISVARQHTNGNITLCFYLVDLLCLGVKDTHYLFNIPEFKYREQLKEISEQLPLEPFEYTLAHNIVYAGIEFAENYGFKPHKDFTSVTRFMLEEDTDDIELIDVECGINGKPSFMRSPYDNEAKTKRIIAQLEKTAGPGNFLVTYEDEDEWDDDEFDDEIEDEIEEMSFDKKKELFLSISSRLDRLDDEEDELFTPLVNSLVSDMIDEDRYNIFYDELYSTLDVEIDEAEIPDELLGIIPGIDVVSDKLKNRFLDIYSLTANDTKLAAKELKAFEEESKGLPGTHFLEILILQMNNSSKYVKRLKKYATQYPYYPLIKLFWVTEQVTSGEERREIIGFPFNKELFFPGRKTIHPIERFYFLSLHLFLTAQENNLDRIEAFNWVLEEFDLSEMEEEILWQIILMLKVNCLSTLLTP